MRLSILELLPRSMAAWAAAGCASAQEKSAAHDKRVLFVCERGNVKSLMAMSYFNRLAEERGLPYRAVSRGTAPASTTVPPKILEGLEANGFDVTGFHPAGVKAGMCRLLNAL